MGAAVIHTGKGLKPLLRVVSHADVFLSALILPLPLTGRATIKSH